MSKRILVDTQALTAYASELSRIGDALYEASGALAAIVGRAGDIEYNINASAPRLSGDSGASVSHGDVAATLASYTNALKAMGGHSQSVATAVNKAANDFETCEKNNTNSFANASGSMGYDEKHGGAGRAIDDFIGGTIISGPGAVIGTGGVSMGIDLGSAIAAVLAAVPNAGSIQNLIPDGLTPGDVLSYIVNLPENIAALGDSVIDTTSCSASAGFSESYYSDDNISFLFAEGSADAGAGVFQRDGDGNVIFSPYATAGAGLSFGLFAGSISESIGNDMLGANASVSTEVLTGSAGARGTVALMDEHGRINPTAKIDASAELTVASVEGNLGVTVAGVDVGVSAEASIGLGAHANVGIEGGVVTVDIGASIGIGGSISVSVDIGGAVNAVVDGACGILDNLFGF